MVWDAWEQRSGIKHGTLHPRHAAEVACINEVQLQLLRRKGNAGLLSQDQALFSIPRLWDGWSLITLHCTPSHLHLHLLSKNTCVFSFERPHCHDLADSATDVGRLYLGVGAGRVQ